MIEKIEKKETVYLCAERRPWRAKPNGGYERISYDDAKIKLLHGAITALKPFDWKNGF